MYLDVIFFCVFYFQEGLIIIFFFQNRERKETKNGYGLSAVNIVEREGGLRKKKK